MTSTPRKQSGDKLDLFAVCAPGLEPLLDAELATLGINARRAEEGGISFRGGHAELYRVNLWSRIAARVLVRVAKFRATAFHELERHAARVAWGSYVSESRVAALRVTCRKSRLYHSDAVAERIARAIQAQAGARVSASSSDEDSDADRDEQMFVVRFFRDTCSISADSSGANLHLRGYREAIGKAPLRETLAAALLQASGWTNELAVLDPMCGSGTIPIEAALVALDIAPGIARASRVPRDYSFGRWSAFERDVWEKIVANAQSRSRSEVSCDIFATDRDAGAVEIAIANAQRAGVSTAIKFEEVPLSAARPIVDAGCVVTNPPYGKRVGDEARLRDLYARLGQLMRSELSHWSLTMLSASTALERQTRLQLEPLLRTTNGGIPVRFVHSEAHSEVWHGSNTAP